jgi:hypothetical protein
MATYQKKKVVTREIEHNDPRYAADKILVVRDDGTEIVVPKAEVTPDEPAPAPKK